MGNGVNLDKSVFELVVAICGDFERRRKLIEEGRLPRRVEMELRYLNVKVYDATVEVVGDDNAEQFINEIGNKVGYAKTQIWDMSECTYKCYKKEVMKNIAKRLYLVG